MKVLGDRVLVKIIEEDEVHTASGLILSQDDKDDDSILRGEVVAISKDCSIKINKGDIVHFNMWAGQEHDFDGVEHVFLDTDELLLIECEDDDE